MRRVHLPITFIITAYGCVLLLLASVFLMRDQALFRMHSTLPVYFLMRFFTFWFISFVLAILVYLASLNLRFLDISAHHKKYCLKIGTVALGGSILLALSVFLLFGYLNI